jgi:hypothetical protein
MRNGYAPINLHLLPAGQFCSAIRSHCRHNARSFGAWTWEGRKVLPQFLSRSGYELIPGILASNQPSYETSSATVLRWIRLLLHLNTMNQLSRLQYFSQYGVCTEPAGQEVRGGFFYNHYILICGYKGLSFLPDYRYNFFYGCRSL